MANQTSPVIQIKDSNVGIGTTNPTGKLHIAQSNSGGVAAILLSEDESTIQGPSGNTQIRMGSNLVLGASNIMTFGTNGSERMRIDASGNVGIKATPSAWASGYSVLNVGDAAAISWTGAGANDFSFSTNAYYDTTDNRWEYRGTGDGSARYSMTALSYEHRWYNAPVGTANAAISYTQAMTLTGGGNLLIGTTTDNGNKLRVQGTTWISGNVYTNGEQGIELGWTGSTLNDQRIGRIRPISTPAQNPYAGGLAFDYYKYDGSTYTWFEGMRLNGAGQLLINATSSAYGPPLNYGYNLGVKGIAGQAFISIARSTQTLDSQGLAIGLDTNEGAIYLRDNLPLSIYTNNTFAMRIAAGGNILIGTTTDSGYKLDVNGTGRVSDVLVVKNTSSTPSIWSGSYGGAISIKGDNSTSNRYLDLSIVDSTGALAAQGLRIINSGNVLIGTTTDAGTKLNVNGVVSATDYYFNGTSSERVVKRYTAGINLAASGYTFIANVTGSSLASAIRMTMQGTSNNVVINVLADIQVNHFQDILITTSSGFYTQVRIRIISNNNDVFSIEVEPVFAIDATTLYVEIFPLNDEVVSFSGSPQTATTLTMTTRQGIYTVGNGGNNGTISAGGDLYVSDNVGIGTTGPAEKLTLTSGSTIATARFTNSTTGLDFRLGTDGVQSSYTNIVFYSDSGNAQIWKAGSTYTSQGGAASLNLYSSNGPIAFHPNGGASSNALFLTTTQNVLIGTTTDTGAKLRVYGGYMTVEGTNTAMYIESNYGGGNGLDAGTLISAGGINSNIVIIPSGGGVAGSKVVGSAYNGSAWRSMLEYANVSSGEPVLSLVKTAGNVGIGNATPTAYNGYTTVHIGSASSIGLIKFGTGAVTDGPEIFTNSNKDIFFNSAGVGTRVVVKGNTGNVLIGTTTDAGYKLYVSGTGRFDGQLLVSADAGNEQFIIRRASNTNEQLILGFHSGDYAVIQAVEQLVAYRPIAINHNGGNVLIGTTTDAGYKLRVVGSSYTTGDVVVAKTTTANANFGGPVLSLGDSTSEVGMCGGIAFAENLTSSLANVTMGIYYDGKANKMHFTASSDAQATAGENLVAATKHMTITRDTGLVGIGATSPSEVLTVNGAGAFRTNANNFQSTSQFTIDYYDGGSTGRLAAYKSTGSNITFFTNPASGNCAEVMRITSAGNVIIGSTTDAGYKLDVHGEILGRDDIRILNTYALILNGTDPNWRIGRNTITDSGWLTSNTLQVVVFGGSSGQGFQVVNTNGTALFEIDGVQGYTRITTSLGVGVDPSGTTGRIDASNDIVAYSSSDLRLKENIKPIENALDKVKALTGVEFDWKAEHKEAHGYEGHDTGVIAQEVQEVMPTAVRTNDTGYLAVRYEKLIGLLIEANKELAEQVANQQSQIDELKKLIK